MRRIRTLQSQVRPQAASGPADPLLLTDAQAKQFVVDGFLALPIKELGSAFHKQVYDKSRAAFVRMSEQADGKFGHPDSRLVFGELPEMSEVIQSPTLRGALTSVLGPGYVQHPHRSMHIKPLESTTVGGDQDWHKDGHHAPMRGHFPRWIICFYYPHATTEDMGPTGLLPGSQYLQMGRHANIAGPSSLVPPSHPARPVDMNGPDLAARDRFLQTSVEALDPALHEHKVSEYCSYGGTVFVLHFDMLHRACRNLPDSIWRNMFKLQFFRTSAPTGPTWAHAVGAEADPFAYTGASPEQKAVWESTWHWMLGTKAASRSPRDVGAGEDTSALHRTLMRSDLERQRICAAYALARYGATQQLAEALVSGSEDASRSAAYGLMAIGDAAVPCLLAAVTTPAAGRCWVPVNALHALSDAVQTPQVEVLDTLRSFLQERTEQMERVVAAQLASPAADEGINHPAAVLRYAMATCIQALGTLGERAVQADDAAIALGVCEALLPFTMSPEPGHLLETYGPNGRAVGGSVFSPCGQQPEFWCREGAAHGLLRLSGGATGKTAIAPSSPAHHGDDRFIPALCRAAVSRLQRQRPRTAVAGAVLGALTTPVVARAWDEMVLRAESEPAPEPWLEGQHECSVEWLD